MAGKRNSSSLPTERDLSFLTTEQTGRNDGCQAIKESGTVCGESQSLNILKEIQRLYEDRLRRIDGEAGGDSTQLTIKTLKSWVNDLGEQNTMLVQTVEQLEREAADRVALLEDSLQRSSRAALEYMTRLQDYDNQINEVTGEKKVNSKISLAQQTEEMLQIRVSNLQNDIAALLELIHRAKRDGSWDTTGLNFIEVTHEDIFGTSPPYQQPTDKDEIVRKLTDEVNELQHNRDRLQAEIDSKDQSIKAMEAQIAQLQGDMMLKDSQIKSFVQKIQELRDNITNKSDQTSDLDRQDPTEARHNELEASMWKQKTSDTERELMKARSELQRAEDDMIARQSEIKNVTQKLHDTEMCLQAALYARDQLTNEVSQLNAQLREKTNDFADLTRKLAEAEKSKKDMREALTAEVAEKHDQVLAVRRDIFVLEEQCRQADMQTHFKDDIIKEMRKDLKLARIKLAYLEGSNKEQMQFMDVTQRLPPISEPPLNLSDQYQPYFQSQEKSVLPVHGQDRILSTSGAYNRNSPPDKVPHPYHHTTDKGYLPVSTMYVCECSAKKTHHVLEQYPAVEKSHRHSSTLRHRTSHEKLGRLRNKSPKQHCMISNVEEVPASFTAQEVVEDQMVHGTGPIAGEKYYEMRRRHNSSNRDVEVIGSTTTTRTIAVQYSQPRQHNLQALSQYLLDMENMKAKEQRISELEKSLKTVQMSLQKSWDRMRVTPQMSSHGIGVPSYDKLPSVEHGTHQKLIKKMDDLMETLQDSDKKIEKKNSKIEDLQGKLKSTQEEMLQLREKSEGYLNQMVVAKKNQEESERRIRELQQALDTSKLNMRKSLSKLEDSMSNQELPEVMNLAADYHIKAEEGQAAFDNMKAELDYLLNNLTTREKQITKLEETIMNLQDSLNTAEEELGHAHDKIDSVMKEKSMLEGLKNNYEVNIQALKEALLLEKDDQHSKLVSRLSPVEELVEKEVSSVLPHEIEKHSTLIQQDQATTKELLVEIDELLRLLQLRDKRIKTMENANEILKQALDKPKDIEAKVAYDTNQFLPVTPRVSIAKVLVDYQGPDPEAKIAIVKVKAEIDSLLLELELRDQQIAKQEGQLAALRDALEDTQEELRKANRDNRTESTKKVCEEHHDIEFKVKALEEDLKDAQQEIQMYRDKLLKDPQVMSKSSLDKMKSSVSMMNYHGKDPDASEKIANLKNDILELLKEIQIRDNQIAKQKEVNKILQEESIKSQDHIQALKRDLRVQDVHKPLSGDPQAHLKIRDLEKDLVAAQDEIKTLQTQLIQKPQITEQDEKFSGMQHELMQTQKDLENVTRLYKKEQAQKQMESDFHRDQKLKELEDKLEFAVKEAQMYKDKLLQESQAAAEKPVVEIKKSVIADSIDYHGKDEEANRNIIELKKEVKNLLTEVHSKDVEVAHLNGQLTNLKQELFQVKDELRNVKQEYKLEQTRKQMESDFNKDCLIQELRDNLKYAEQVAQIHKDKRIQERQENQRQKDINFKNDRKIYDLESDLKSADSELEWYKEKFLQDSQMEAENDKSRALREEIFRAQEEIKSLKNEVKIQQVQKDLSTASREKRIKDLEDDLKIAGEQINAYRDKITQQPQEESRKPFVEPKRSTITESIVYYGKDEVVNSNILNLKKEVNNLLNDVHSRDIEIANLNAQLSNLNDDLFEVQDEFQKVKKESRLEQSSKEMESALQKDRIIKKLEDNLKNAEQNIQLYEDRLLQATQVASPKTSVKITKSIVSDTTDYHGKDEEASRSIMNLKQEINRLMNELASREAEVASQGEKNKILQEELLHLWDEVRALKRESKVQQTQKDLSVESYAQRIRDLEEDLKSAKEQIKMYKNKLSQKREVKTSRTPDRKRSAEVIATVNDTNHAIVSVNREVNDLLDDVKSRDAQVPELRKSANTEDSSDEISYRRVGKLKKEIINLKEDLQSRDYQIAHLSDQLIDLQQELFLVRDSLQTVRREAKLDQAKKLTDKDVTKDRRIKELEEKLKYIEKENEMYRNKLLQEPQKLPVKEVKSTIALSIDYRGKDEEANRNIRDLKEEINKLLKEINSRDSQIALEEGKNKTLRDELIRNQDEIKNLQREQKIGKAERELSDGSYTERIKDLKEHLKASEEEIKMYKDRLKHKKQASGVRFNIQKRPSITDAIDYKSKDEEANHHIEELNHEIQKLSTYINFLEGQVTYVTNQLSESQKELFKGQDQMQELKKSKLKLVQKQMENDFKKDLRMRILEVDLKYAAQEVKVYKERLAEDSQQREVIAMKPQPVKSTILDEVRYRGKDEEANRTIDNLKAEISRLEDELNFHNAQIASQEKRNKTLQGDLSRAQEELQSVKREYQVKGAENSMKCDTLEQKLRDVEEDLKSSEKENNMYREKSMQRPQLEVRKSPIERRKSIMAELLHYHGKDEEALRNIASLNKKISEFQDEIHIKDAQISYLKDQVSGLNKELLQTRDKMHEERKQARLERIQKDRQGDINKDRKIRDLEEELNYARHEIQLIKEITSLESVDTSNKPPIRPRKSYIAEAVRYNGKDLEANRSIADLKAEVTRLLGELNNRDAEVESQKAVIATLQKFALDGQNQLNDYLHKRKEQNIADVTVALYSQDKDQRILQLEGDLSIAQEDIRQMQVKLDLAEQRLSQKPSHITVRKSVIRELATYRGNDEQAKEVIEELNKELDNLLMELETRDRQNKLQEDMIDSLRIALVNAENEIRILKEARDQAGAEKQLKSRVASLEKELELCYTKIKNYEEDKSIERLKEEIVRLENKLKEREAEMGKLYEEKEHIQRTSNNEREETENKAREMERQFNKSKEEWEKKMKDLKNGIKEYEGKVSSLQSKLQQTKDEIESERKAKENIQQALTKATDCENELKRNMEEWEKKIKELQNKLSEYEEKLPGLKSKLHISELEKEKNEIVYKKKEELEALVENLQIEVKTLHSALNAKEKVTEDQKEMLTIQENTLKLTQDELHDLQGKLKNFDKLLEEQKKVEEQQATISNLQQALLTTKHQLEELQGKGSFEAQCQELKKDNEQLRKQCRDLEDGVEKLRQQKDELTKKLGASEEIQTKTEWIDKLKAQVDSKVQNEELRQLNDALKEQNAFNSRRLQEQNQQIEQVYPALKKNYDDVVQHNQELELELVGLRGDIVEFQYQLDFSEERTATAQRELDGCKDVLNTMKEKIETLKDMLLEKSNLVTHLEQDCAATKEDVDALSAEAELMKAETKDQMNNLRQSVFNLQNHLDVSNANYQRASEDCQRHQNRLLDAANREVKLQKEFSTKENALMNELQESRTENLRSSDVVDLLNRENQDLKTELTEREGQLQATASKLQSLSRDSTKLQKEMENKENSLQKLEGAFFVMKTQLRQAMDQLQEKENLIQDLNKDIAKTQMQLKHLEAQNMKCREQLKFMKLAVSSADDRNNVVNQQVENYAIENSSLIDKCNKLENEVLSMQEELLNKNSSTTKLEEEKVKLMENNDGLLKMNQSLVHELQQTREWTRGLQEQPRSMVPVPTQSWYWNGMDQEENTTSSTTEVSPDVETDFGNRPGYQFKNNSNNLTWLSNMEHPVRKFPRSNHYWKKTLGNLSPYSVYDDYNDIGYQSSSSKS